ncbi:MAG TPA: P1 family peptidase [Solirubrobacteraceae bacterium]|jgi:L-aminopeptidase/D-esterase-like protein|nr:P1 family peptidase [Solirubrobacteraceae bacterium]
MTSTDSTSAPEHVDAALAAGAPRPVAEGSVGAGTGMI